MPGPRLGKNVEYESDDDTVVIGTVIKVLLQGIVDLEIRGQVETIETAALLRSAIILKRALETWGDVLSLKLQWETIG